MAPPPPVARRTGLALCFEGRAVAVLPGMAPERPSPGEVLFRPALVMVDARDRAAAAPSSVFRGVLGHRAVGRLDGGPAGLFAVSPHVVCAVCDLCRAGLSVHCRLRRTLGLAGRNGCLGEAVSIPPASARPVPISISPEAALFALDAGRALHIARGASTASRTFVTVVGDSPLALITAQVLARSNARVRLLGRTPSHAELCERWGVKHRPVDDAGHRNDQDLVTVCSDDPRDLLLACAHVRPRGLIALAPPSGLIEPRAEAAARCARLEVTLLNIDWGDIDEGLALLASGGIDTTRLIAGRLSLEAAGEAFAPASAPNGLGMLVVMPAAPNP